MSKTGNCWNGRHHTCKGEGTETRDGRRSVPYICDCDCHKMGLQEEH